MRGLAERVQQRRSAAPSRRLWAGPFCSSRRPSRSASHESARGARSRAGRVSWLAAHCAARRVGVSAARRARFCCILAAIRFLRFTPRAGVCFAGGLARCGCGLPCLGFCEFRVQSRTFNPGCTGQIGKFAGQIRNHGFFLLCTQITHIFSNQLSPTRVKRSFPVWPSFAAKWSSGIGVCSHISLHRDSRMSKTTLELLGCERSRVQYLYVIFFAFFLVSRRGGHSA